MRTDADKGFSVVETGVIVLILTILGFGAWFVYHWNPKTNDSQQSTATTRTESPSKYNGWKTYTSPYEGLSFKYPSDWTVKQVDSLVEGADAAKISLGEVGIFWNSAVDGIGGACDSTWTPSTPEDIDPTLGPCRYYYVIHKQKLDNLDAYYVSGVTQVGYEHPHFETWCALQPHDGVLTDRSVAYLPVIQTKSGAYGARLTCIDPLTYSTKQAALDRLNSVYSRSETIKLIMLSATY